MEPLRIAAAGEAATGVALVLFPRLVGEFRGAGLWPAVVVHVVVRAVLARARAYQKTDVSCAAIRRGGPA